MALLAAPAMAVSMGRELTASEVKLHEGTELSSGIFWNSDSSSLRTENYVTCVPGGAVTPVVTFGTALTERLSVTGAARRLEAAGYRVVAGVNGDYYNTGNGLPVGLVITEGTLRSTDGGYYALGFRADGSAFIGRPQLRLSADLGYSAADGTRYVRTLAALNKARADGGIYLYTSELNSRHSTGTTAEGVSVICRITDGWLRPGGQLTAEVLEVSEGTASPVLEEDQVALTATSASNLYYTDVLRNIPIGTQITVTVTASDPVWEEAEYAVGALYPVLSGGVTVSSDTARNPRTAVGVKEDGSFILYTMDGRGDQSSGAGMKDVALRLAELGCTDAVCLDGGGSTTMVVTKPSELQAEVVNVPSGGSARAVTDQVFLVARNEPSGILDRFYVEPARTWVLAGTAVDLAVSGVDTCSIPMEADYTLSASAGVLEGETLLTPAEGGEITVTAEGGGAAGSAVVHAVAAPDTLTVLSGGKAARSIALKPGAAVSLGASAEWDHLKLGMDETLLQWEFIGTCAAVYGAELRAIAPGEGTLAVTAGGTRTEIPVTVSAVSLRTVEDFESEAALDEGDGIVDMTAERTSDPALVGRGRYSAVFRYTLEEDHDNTAQWRWASGRAADTGGYTALDLWVRGDGSGNVLEILCSGGDTLPAVVLDFTGWRQMTLALPGGSCTLQGVRISAPVEESEDGRPVFADTPRTGEVLLDQMTASFPGLRDTKAPAVTLELSEDGTRLDGTVRDETDGIPAGDAVLLTRDGKSMEYVYDASTGTLRAVIEEDGQPHRFTLTAKDASGNIGRASWDLEGAEGTRRFTDTADYWAADYADYLYDAGITTGYGDGTFRPDQNITRAQFAAMLFRYLGLDTELWADVELSFADSEDIPVYARPAAAALSAMGVITGSPGVDGELLFDPSGLLTRAQAAAMIGRTQEKGYAESGLTFQDAGRIPAYAAPYIRTMTAQGILSGYGDGTFRPARSITRGQMAKILYNLM